MRRLAGWLVGGSLLVAQGMSVQIGYKTKPRLFLTVSQRKQTRVAKRVKTSKEVKLKKVGKGKNRLKNDKEGPQKKPPFTTILQ